jgi:hypothetical protein
VEPLDVAFYIFDASAVIALEEACLAAHVAFNEVSDVLTDLAIGQDLACPPIVLRECREYGDSDAGTRWLKSVSGHFVGNADPWEYLETVLTGCPTLINPDDPNESPQATVLAMALYKSQSRQDVVLVTDQWINMPNRIALGPAALQLGIDAIATDALVAAVTAAV